MRILRLTVIISFAMFFAKLSFAQNPLTLHFLDVDEGEVFLIESESGNILIDTGSLLNGYGLADYLRKNGVSRIKYLIITHLHPDHMSGIFFILPKFQIEKILDNGQALNEDNDIERWYGMLVRGRENYAVLKKGSRLQLGKTYLEVLWPAQPDYDSYNANSLVIRLNYKDNFSCLFMSDADSSVEGALLTEGVCLKADVLKVGHHGYKDATSGKFLETVSPQLAIISVGPKNRLGAPSPSVLESLKNNGTKVFRTDINGSIVVVVDTKGRYSVKTER